MGKHMGNSHCTPCRLPLSLREPTQRGKHATDTKAGTQHKRGATHVGHQVTFDPIAPCRGKWTSDRPPLPTQSINFITRTLDGVYPS